MESPTTKRRKIDESKVFDSENKLSDLVDWRNPGNVAIEYHESLGNSIDISYDELKENVRIIEEVFGNLEAEFIGIDADVPGIYIPALMLGINASKNAFVCLPPSSPEATLLKNHLEIVHIISSRPPEEPLHEIHIHTTKLFLSKFISPVKSTKNLKSPFAYAVTTSGTTGAPKVIRVTENSIIPNIKDLKAMLTLSSDDKIAQLTPLTFDPCVIEIFISLSSGSRLFIASSGLKNDPANLLTSIQTSRVTVIQSTPSVLMHRWSLKDLESTIFEKTSALRILLLGGELFPDPTVLFNLRHNDCRFFNVYGITEVSCWASLTEIFQTSDPNDLGELLTDTQFRIINENTEIITDGEGELLIGSDTRICLLNDEKINEIELPIFRKTGDLVKIEKSGKILFNGRKNRRVKRFGHRIDLQHLENHVNQLKFVKKSVALFNSENQSIQIFFTTQSDVKDENLKRNYEKEVLFHIKKLTSVYYPNKISLITSFPVNKNGKVCFESLNKLSENFLGNVNELDLTEVFERIWCNYLTMKNCGFLSAGGSSIIALQIANEFTGITGNEYPELIGRLLKNETFESCKVYISRGKSENIENEIDEIIVGGSLKNEINSLENTSGLIKEEKTSIFPENTEFNHGNNLISLKSIEFNEANSLNEEKNENEESKPKTNLMFHENMEFDVKHETEHKIENNDWTWQKCRGKTTFNTKFQQIEQTEVQYLNSTITPSTSSLKAFKKPFNKINLTKSYDLSKCIDASATIFEYNSTIYTTVGSHSGIICTVKLTDVDDNENNWRVYLPDRIEASVLIAPEFTGIVGCYDGFVYCVHLKSGEIRWKFRTGDAVKCTAVFSSDGERIFFGSYDHSVYCLSVETGSEVWKTTPSTASISASGIAEKSTNSVFFGTLDGTCVALNQQTGEILWKKRLKHPIFSSPVISQNRSIIICDVSGVMVGLRLASGEKLWEVNIRGNVFSHLVIQKNPAANSEDLILASRDKQLYQFIIKSYDNVPHLRRKIKFSSPIIATPWVERSFIVVATINGELVIVNSENGNFIGQYKVEGEVYSSPVVEGEFIAVGCRDNNFYIFSCD